MDIRRYTQGDLHRIMEIDAFAALQIQHHQGVRAENIVCVFDKDQFIGFGFLILNYGLGKKGRHIVEFFVNLSIGANAKVNSQIMDVLIRRFEWVRRSEPEENMCLRIYCEANEVGGIQFFLRKGFALSGVIPILKYDLTQSIPTYSLPDEIEIRKLDFTSQNMEAYLGADFISSSEIESEATAWFRTKNPSYACYAAFHKKRLVGAICTLNISDGNAATENIFVIPEYRRNNIARSLISVAFNDLKARGDTLSTISMRGTNLPAMNLYLSCGYTLYYNLLEMTYS